MKRFLKVVGIGALCAFFVCIIYIGWDSRRDLTYQETIGKTAFTINGTEVKMEELAFYILYEEREIEAQAEVYNPDNTKDYWNLHINGVFIQDAAKEAVMGMAVHDIYFYEMSIEEGLILDAEDETYLSNSISDFWMDLYDEQLENISVSEEFITVTMRKIALAEKYQVLLAEKTGNSYNSYDWDGANYEKLLEEQDLEINDRIWDRIVVGDISLDHDLPNYVNGQ